MPRLRSALRETIGGRGGQGRAREALAGSPDAPDGGLTRARVLGWPSKSKGSRHAGHAMTDDAVAEAVAFLGR